MQCQKCELDLTTVTMHNKACTRIGTNTRLMIGLYKMMMGDPGSLPRPHRMYPETVDSNNQ